MKYKHTAEPWRAGKDGQSIICDTKIGKWREDNEHLAHYGGYVVAETVTPSNRDRIIACVNPCAGINPEAVPDLLSALRRLVSDVKQLEGYWTEGTGNLISDAEAALAKAKPLVDADKS